MRWQNRQNDQTKRKEVATMTQEVLASKKFTAKGNGEIYNITLSLIPSGCNPYGNKHALLYEVEGCQTQCFDARYDKRFNTAETFNKYAYEFVRDQIREDLIVAEVV